MASNDGLYSLLSDFRCKPLGPRSWIANLRWLAEETDGNLNLAFRTECKDISEGEYPFSDSPNIFARRTFFGLHMENAGTIKGCTYRADGLNVSFDESCLDLLMPLKAYGTVISLRHKMFEKAIALIFNTPESIGSNTKGRSSVKHLTSPARS